MGPPRSSTSRPDVVSVTDRARRALRAAALALWRPVARENCADSGAAAQLDAVTFRGSLGGRGWSMGGRWGTCGRDGSAGNLGVVTTQPRPQSPAGMTVGDYTLLSRIGEGGMGVVHLARKPGGDRVALKVLRPAHRGRRRGPGAAGPRGQLAQPDPQPLGGRDRRRRPVGRDPVRGHPLRPGSLAARPRRRRGPDHRRRPHLVRRLPRRGRRLRARGRRPAPRRQALQRADGGPHADPHRLRPGPGRRRPEAHPHRLAARHARLPRARDPVRRRRHRRVRRALLGGHGRVRRHRPRRRSAAARRWRSWTGSGAASTTCPGSPTTLRGVVEAALDPDPATGRRSTGCSAGCGPRPPGCRRSAAPADRGTTRTPSRSPRGRPGRADESATTTPT